MGSGVGCLHLWQGEPVLPLLCLDRGAGHSHDRKLITFQYLYLDIRSSPDAFKVANVFTYLVLFVIARLIKYVIAMASDAFTTKNRGEAQPRLNGGLLNELVARIFWGSNLEPSDL